MEELGYTILQDYISLFGLAIYVFYVVSVMTECVALISVSGIGGGIIKWIIIITEKHHINMGIFFFYFPHLFIQEKK